MTADNYQYFGQHSASEAVSSAEKVLLLRRHGHIANELLLIRWIPSDSEFPTASPRFVYNT